MSYWFLQHPDDQVSCVDQLTGCTWTYGVLRQKVDDLKRVIGGAGAKKLGLVLCRNSPDFVAAYVASMQLRHAVILLDAGLAQEFAEEIINKYAPDWIFAPSAWRFSSYEVTVNVEGGSVFLRQNTRDRSIYSELAVLLSTSGSTGSPKLVRLSYDALAANAASIASYLRLDRHERPITTMPMGYSYGLSIINSHLLVGAAILLSDKSVIQREFWDFFCVQRATSFGGVPYTYQMLLRTGVLQNDLPSLSTLTQAGGRLDPHLVEHVHAIAFKRGWRFFVMYGQTEATARISYLSPDNLPLKAGSIGRAIPGGSLAVDADTSELIYRGPNVMLGYAECEADLAKGDELFGELRTGDLARQDADGFFYLTGRLRRFLKIFGQRFNLDEIEAVLRRKTGESVACFGQDDKLTIALDSPLRTDAVAGIMRSTFHLHHTAYRVICVEQIPHNARGKVDYGVLSRLESVRSN